LVYAISIWLPIEILQNKERAISGIIIKFQRKSGDQQAYFPGYDKTQTHFHPIKKGRS
jgi:hypothetical protein